ncbi:type II secretion system protein [Candidatus Nesciobacter abundans]|uniref:Type II secretion system protein n=1 Tax=Candidatus Nesciobacter abundans TaxID=2601668 RepID=A0A5C0UIA0_9PROT|nr:type II secretion system protein [Candidatus Nesciobacter abundans]QEK39132.1 type II secretion system protein [Candidatus Nesciobacter abundans]
MKNKYISRNTNIMYINNVKKFLRPKGFSMLEMAIVLVIFGSLSSIMFSSMQKYVKWQRSEVTKSNMEKILKSLGTFVSSRGRLPYPSTPSNKFPDPDNPVTVAPGFEYPWPKNDKEWGNIYLYSGIVPFKTLQIPEHMAKDGNGRYFTYVMDTTLGGRTYVESVSPNDDRIKYEYDSDDKDIKISSFCFVRHYGDPTEITKGEITKGVGDSGYFKHIGLNFRASLVDLVHWREKISLIEDKTVYAYQLMYPEYIPQNNLATKYFISEMYQHDNDLYRQHHRPYVLNKAFSAKMSSSHKGLVVRDTIAVVLISHGDSGGWITPNGTRQPLKGDVSRGKRCNSKHNGSFFETDIETKKDKSKIFDDTVLFVSRFNFAALYGGFLCESLSSSQRHVPYIPAPHIADKIAKKQNLTEHNQ